MKWLKWSAHFFDAGTKVRFKKCASVSAVHTGFERGSAQKSNFTCARKCASAFPAHAGFEGGSAHFFSKIHKNLFIYTYTYTHNGYKSPHARKRF